MSTTYCKLTLIEHTSPFIFKTLGEIWSNLTPKNKLAKKRTWSKVDQA